ncbi:MAG: hypothetical protein ACFFG0_52130, partial [Candidatus Thorarchaeota archaeon]
GSEIRNIEETETDQEQIWNKNVNFRTFALSTQIEILQVTDLIGVFIKGYKTPEANETIKFQLQGFNDINLSPNGIIYRSIDLNISTSLDWYYQDFSSNPITLSIGNYSLVMNGTNLSINDKARYFWQKDNIDPEIPFLYTSSYVTSWALGIVNTTFLCKLMVSNPNKLYFPSELNMTAQIDGDNYEITDGLTLGKGFLNISNFNYIFKNINLNIPILINKSLILNYNYNYSININNNFSTMGSAVIKEPNNQWLLLPQINKIASNYYAKFIFPKNWYNLTLYRKIGSLWTNVTTDAIFPINANTLIIPNNIILDGAEWKIAVTSPNIIFDINLHEDEWKPGQEVQFTVNAPILEGNLTFYIINSLGFGYNDPVDVREVEYAETIFTYVIPVSAREGTYTIIIYWNNNTDAGVQFQNFQVLSIPVPINPIWIVIGIALSFTVSFVGFLSYRTIKKFRIRKIEEEEKLYNKCMDVLNLDYIIVSEKKSGINVYQQKFTSKDIDASMISGFLQAIHSFGIELIKIEDSSQTIKLEYKDSIIIMTEFVNLRIILIMKEAPSSNFLYSLEDLAFDLYKYYGKLVERFNGDIKPFKSIEKLLKHHLNTSLTYPLRLKKIEKMETIRISSNEREFINKAVSFMKMNNTDTFNLPSILTDQECSPKEIEIILKLIEKDLFQIIE